MTTLVISRLTRRIRTGFGARNLKGMDMFNQLSRSGRRFHTNLFVSVVAGLAITFVLGSIPNAMAAETAQRARTGTSRDIIGSKRDLYRTQGGHPIYALEKQYADRCNPNTFIYYVMCGRGLSKALIVAARDEGAVGHLFLCSDQSNFYDDGSMSQVTKFSPCVGHGEIEFTAEPARLIGVELRDKSAINGLCNQAAAYYKRHKKQQRDMGIRDLPTYDQLIHELQK